MRVNETPPYFVFNNEHIFKRDPEQCDVIDGLTMPYLSCDYITGRQGRNTNVNILDPSFFNCTNIDKCATFEECKKLIQDYAAVNTVNYGVFEKKISLFSNPNLGFLLGTPDSGQVFKHMLGSDGEEE